MAFQQSADGDRNVPLNAPGSAGVLPPDAIMNPARITPEERSEGLIPPIPVPESDGQSAATLHFGSWLENTEHNVLSDYRNYYSWTTARELAMGVGVAGIMANTRLDQDFRNWDQQHARNSSTNHFADAVRDFGGGWYTVPAFAAMDLLGETFDDHPCMAVMGDFGDRTLRAYAVGAPPMLLMQELLGSSRPADSGTLSHWEPFHASNGVSGHAFMGSVPFITAANMTDNIWAKCGLYVCSTFTGWSRLNDDKHYLSQVCLGWWMGYLACQAVDGTQRANRHFFVEPLVSPDMTGIGITYQH